MQIAARNGSLSVMKLLYENGSSLNTRGKKGDTIFHLAAANGHTELMQWANDMGAVASCVDMFGQTPAHVAARRGESSVLKYLYHTLDLDMMQEDFDGRTPLQVIPRQAMHGNEAGIHEARRFLISIIEGDT